MTLDVLAAHEPEGPPSRRPWWLVGAAVALVLALVGAVTYGVAALSGGGEQPEQALPAGAIAFAKVDLDPAAGQKIDAIRFLRKFPALRERLAGDADLRKVLFDAVAGDAGWGDIDFSTQVAPWLGRRVAVAVYPATGAGSSGRVAAGNPSVVVALQVGDQAKARAGLDRLVATGRGSRPGYVITGGYALLASSRTAAQAAADRAARADLATDSVFAGDLGQVPAGIVTFWVSGHGLAATLPAMALFGLAPQGTGPALGAGAGRAVYTLRFDGPDVLEVAGRVIGAAELTGPSARLTGFADLPASTVAALGVGGSGAIVRPAWTAARKQLDGAAARSFDDQVADLEQRYDVTLPADLELLLGSNLLVALDGTGLGDGDISLGARVASSDPRRADALLGRLVADAFPGEPDVVHHTTADGYVVASDSAQAARLTSPAGRRLADLPAFRAALPDLDTARFAAWLDVRTVVADLLGGRDGAAGGASRALAPIAGFGVTASSDSSGDATFRARLVTR